MTTIAPFNRFRSANYRSLGLVGQGQFGQVYCAIHGKTGRLVALKNLNRDRFPTHRFLRELRFLLSLEHPHIANCRALEQSSQGRQLVLDYCEGGTLRDLLEQSVPLSLGEILTMASEILEALKHAHQKGIIHCDIKPENILLTLTPNGWQTKVSDFGIARLSQELQGQYAGATGSPAYMAPERFYFQYSSSSDLYAVGIILYELLTGDRPFSGSYNQLMVAHLNQSITFPDALPEAVRMLLTRAMEKLTARRFRSAVEMKTAIAIVRQTLSTAELNTLFPKPQANGGQVRFVPQTQIPLPAASKHVVLLRQDDRAYTFVTLAEKSVQSWRLSDKTQLQHLHQWQSEAAITQVAAAADRLFGIADNALYQFTQNQPPKKLAAFEESVELLQGGERWLVAHSLSNPRRFWLIDPLAKVLETPRSFTVEGLVKAETRAIVSDERYLIVAQTFKLETSLWVLTRWGKPLGRFQLKSPLHYLVPSQKPFQFLAQAGTHKQDLLIVQLKPYRVKRCRLGITADWIGELAIGLAVISRNGQMQLVSFEGQILTEIHDLPVPDAIAFQAPFHIWLINHQSGPTQLHCLDIRSLTISMAFDDRNTR